jgi:hypothetical protein
MKELLQAGTACVPSPETEVQQYQHTLSCSLDELSDRLQNLQSRLVPVSRCVCQPTLKEDVEVEKELVPIASIVRTHNANCVDMIHRVNGLIDRLEI